MLDSTRSTRFRGLALVAVTAIALTGCSADSEAPSSAGSEQSSSPTPESSDSSPTATPTGPETTAPGTKLSFGDTATVDHESSKKSGLLDLTVKSADQGSLDDFKGFDLDDPYKRRGSYYYVRVAVQNAGKRKFGGFPVPLWGISDKGTLLRPVDFRSAFSTCPTEPLPQSFEPGDKFETCLVYLSPNHGSLKGVSYRPTVDFQPIEWRGRVESQTSKKPTDDKKDKKGKGENG